MNKEQLLTIIQCGHTTDGDLADALLAELAKVQEPVAYMLRNDVDGVDLSDEAFSWDKDVTTGHTVAVYTHPSPSVPGE